MCLRPGRLQQHPAHALTAADLPSSDLEPCCATSGDAGKPINHVEQIEARTIGPLVTNNTLLNATDEASGLMCNADRGKSVIVKYLTSSKLTRLQLRDAAFRRTLLLQCLVLLHACAHPIAKKPNPIGTAGPKTVVPPLKEKQASAVPLSGLFRTQHGPGVVV